MLNHSIVYNRSPIVILFVNRFNFLSFYSFQMFIEGNVDKAGPGKIFIMIYCQNQSKEFQPISIPIEIQSRPGNHICISFTPPTIGIYRLYLAYRNLPVNGKLQSYNEKKYIVIICLCLCFSRLLSFPTLTNASKIERISFFFPVYK